MIVSGITPADKRRSRVYLDGSFAFVLYNGEIKRFHIEEGEELAQELYSQIMDEVLCRRARERMLHLLKSTSRTELEIRRKLGEALYPQQAIDKAVAFAKRYHHIDDDDYAARYFEIYGDKKSVRQLAAELRRKGIERETVNRLAGESGGEETEKARALLRKKHYDPEQADLAERRRAAAFLARRGFSGDVIRRAMGRGFDFDDVL